MKEKRTKKQLIEEQIQELQTDDLAISASNQRVTTDKEMNNIITKERKNLTDLCREFLNETVEVLIKFIDDFDDEDDEDDWFEWEDEDHSTLGWE